MALFEEGPSGICLCVTPKDSELYFASCQVSDGDEVWHFEDTGLALVVRREDEGTVRLIAQALPVKSTSGRDRKAIGMNHVLLDKVLLLILVLWTSFDSKDDDLREGQSSAYHRRYSKRILR